jgi:hypothetical protein
MAEHRRWVIWLAVVATALALVLLFLTWRPAGGGIF